jgi:transposase-like protein
MGMSRRKFTREVKLAAIQQLEAGSSAAEVARAFEINANLLHDGGRSFAMARAMHSLELANGAGKRRGWRNWSGRWVSRAWKSIF